MSTCCIIIPCFNEEMRLDQNAFLEFVAYETDYSLLFVNDGSTDKTYDVLKKIKEQQPDKINILDQEQNRGKAEAIRTGMLHALKLSDYRYIAFLDADMATPINEIKRLVLFLQENNNFDIAIGSRIKRLGAQIQRSEMRHYSGRLFVTYTNILLPVNAYDSQCGAKVFRSSIVDDLFDISFVSKWFFDIEIILRSNKNRIAEVPLLKWTEMGESRLKMKDFLKAPFEILRIRKHYIKKH